MNRERHDAMLDDVAVYALGAASPADARRVREHLAQCDDCRAEYAALRPAVGLVATSAEACESGQNGPHASALIKARLMRAVRGDAARSASARGAAIVWPAYLVAAACIAIALGTTVANISGGVRLKTAEAQLQTMQADLDADARRLDESRTTIADLTGADAKRYPVANGTIVARGEHIYLAMHDMPAPPKGRVYQAWTLPKGAKAMAPSVTFVPDAKGVAVVALPQDARATSVVAISVEPDGGSKAPTTKPIAVATLN